MKNEAFFVSGHIFPKSARYKYPKIIQKRLKSKVLGFMAYVSQKIVMRKKIGKNKHKYAKY